MKKILLVASLLFLTACGGGGSSSGPVEETIPGTMIPARFVGTYTGTLNVTARGGGLTESDSFTITITVTSDGNLTFDGDDPGESFTVGLTNAGDFSGNIDVGAFIVECSGNIAVVGMVDGTTASGTVEGDGECEEGIVSIDVELEGDFSATK